MSDEVKCYAVMDGDDAANAVYVINGTPKKQLQEFLHKYAGEDIRTVSLAKAKELLGVYFSRKADANDAEPQFDLEDAIAQKANA